MGNTSSAYETTQCRVTLPHQAGTFQGQQYDTKSRRYANIPYACPPTGDLRWRKPRPLPKDYSYSASDGAPFDATNFGKVCPQPNYSETIENKNSGDGVSEDCLRLNIWTPCKEESSDGGADPKWPVMVWFHGGWFQIGDPCHEASMDPVELIGEIKAVFVAVGFRLNVFGFLAGSALQEESSTGGAGNYGLWDQRLAMDWIYDNIAAFGGDPQNIVLTGRSAGAYSVQAQTLYDFRGKLESSERNRFRRLVMYSNAIPAQPKKVTDCQEQFDELCNHFKIPCGADGAEKLRRLREIPAGTLIEAIMQLRNHTFRPVTDGEFIHDGMFEYYRSGAFAAEFKRRGMRLYIGEVLNEDSLYAVTNGPEANLDSLKAQVSNYYAPEVTSRVLEAYKMPSTDNKRDWEAVFGHIVADGQVRVPSRFLVNSLLAHGVSIQDVWRYRISYRMSFITEKVAPASFGVTHAMDRPIFRYV